ncbi:hypothetical protein ACIFOC_00405 [Leucobacter aridicollis]|uniref:hypothetical protein n=1 Tax=Leucobacter aridicollis TaxID=283878 RepID=UPI0037C69985
MSDRTPSLTTVRAAWCRAHPFWATTDVEEREAEFDRMIAEVERAAAEKAWDEGNTEGARGQRDFHLYQQGQITEAEYEHREQARPHPYRRNEGENE